MSRGAPRTYRRLDGAMVATTAIKLADRVAERFPASGLAGVADELAANARTAGREAHGLTRPYYGLRTLVVLVVVGGVAAQVWAARLVDWSALKTAGDPVALTPVIESAVNLLLLMGAGAWFLLTLEERLRRSRVQAWLHRLRAFAHVVDMHQLTKDPTVILNPGPRTPSSPDRAMTRFELARYLEYCAEMLALTGKLAAVMAGESSDHVIIAGASDVENLCTDLGRKVWQKIMILGELDERG
ncbi:hypothetical protein [Caulobacter sp. NIBR1757]|uniref:hypothetical protein n=1 Tax=Caulobacter sp. NIBR1757 TaxID=3016000 RepID=UPI0022F1081A|nr:hypothetical protein [Caulobacter sp. NIBR1757]WGM37479.1 hypothetical protein AMEJIAPC_00377 [Caulobacter sp. NIBR1757]